MRTTTIVAIAGTIFLAALVSFTTPSAAQPQVQLQGPLTASDIRFTLITASGSGEAVRPPDRAVVSLGVTITEKTAALATDALNKRLAAATRAIKGTALPGLLLQTQWVSVSPQFNYQDQAEGKEFKVVGYQASTTLRVQLDDPKNAGDVIDAAVAAGGNTIQGVSFELAKRDPAEAEALTTATSAARRKADVMAAALGLRITRVIEARTGVAAGPSPMYGMEKMMMASNGGRGNPTSVETGEITITAEATVSFAAEPIR